MRNGLLTANRAGKDRPLPVRQAASAVYVDAWQDYLPRAAGAGPVTNRLLRHLAAKRLRASDDAVLLAEEIRDPSSIKLG
jgi:hypothetical protein